MKNSHDLSRRRFISRSVGLSAVGGTLFGYKGNYARASNFTHSQECSLFIDQLTHDFSELTTQAQKDAQVALGYTFLSGGFGNECDYAVYAFMTIYRINHPIGFNDTLTNAYITYIKSRCCGELA